MSDYAYEAQCEMWDAIVANEPTKPSTVSQMSERAYEAAFPRVMEAVATGATRGETIEYLTRLYSDLLPEDRETILKDALDDCLSCGIEREDIDPSWL